MGFISDIFNKTFVQPVAKELLKQAKPTDTVPSQTNVMFGFNSYQIDQARRQAYANVTFQTLRQLSVNHETSRAAINLRKRQIAQLDWDIVEENTDDDPKYTDDQRMAIKRQVRDLGGPGVTLRNLLDLLIEDTLVLDAFCFYKQKSYGGKLYRIIPIDGATIKLRVEEDTGLTPPPPEIAYEQWIRGTKVADLTTDDMIYRRMNPRTTTPYGLSPIESLILTIDLSLRASMYNSGYLSDNNVPQGFLGVPPEWTVAQIKEYKEFLDAAIASPKEQAKIFPIPSGAKYQPTSKPNDFSFKDLFDYLDRKVCMLFDLTPQELGLTLQQYKENAKSQQQISENKGLKPLAHFVEDIFTELIQKDLGYEGVLFKFGGVETRFNKDDVQTYLPLGIISIDEVRKDMALPKLNVPHLIMQGGVITPVSEFEVDEEGNFINQPAPVAVSGMQNQPVGKIEHELKLWEKKILNNLKKGKTVTKFDSDLIPSPMHKLLSETLSKAKTPDQVKRTFELIKKKSNRKSPITKFLRTQTAKDFKKSSKNAIRKAIKPFTSESLIGKITKTEKDITGDVTGAVDDFYTDVRITGLEEYIRKAMEAGGQNAYSVLNIKAAFELKNEVFSDYFAERENYLIDSVNESTKDFIVGKIVSGKMAGYNNAQIADTISSMIDDISDYRADTIVNTEVANAMQQAEIHTYYDQGIEKKTWVTSEDDLVDDECAELDGEIVGIGDNFSSGDSTPPLHPNCRCYIQAVLDSDQ